MAKVEVKCDYCGNLLFRYVYNKNSRFFCDKDCKHSFMRGKTLVELHGGDKARLIVESLKQKMIGPLNPNYGNTWSDEEKEHQSLFMKNVMSDPEIRYKAGSVNRGVKFTEDRIRKMHGHRDKKSYTRPMKDETKILVGLKSKEKWTPEYKIKHRKTMETLGFWVPLNEKSDYEIYFKFSDWNFSMYPIIDYDKFIEDTVRDHIIPRWVGYKFGVFPEIIRHPLNCQIISRVANISKGFSDRKIDLECWSELTYSLICSILNFNKSWHEQEICAYYCNAYLNGERYVNPY